MFLGVPGWMEIVVIVFIVLLLFGKRIPEAMRSLGRGIVEFKKGLKGAEDEVEKVGSSGVGNKTLRS